VNRRECERLFKLLKGKLLRGLSKEGRGKNIKGDTTAYFDRHIEETAIDFIKKNSKYGAVIISEEQKKPRLTGRSRPADRKIIIMDPVDGSDNYIKDIPFVSFGIGVLNADMTPYLGFAGNYYSGAAMYCGPEGYYYSGAGSGGVKKNKRTIFFTFSGLKPGDIKRAAALLPGYETVRSMGATIAELMCVTGGAAEAFIDIRGKLTLENFAPFFKCAREKKIFMCGLDGREIVPGNLSMKKGYKLVGARDRKTAVKICRLLNKTVGF